MAFSLCSTINATYQVLHPYKITVKSILLYFSIFTILDNMRAEATEER
jgi:hypothetical protein